MAKPFETVLVLDFGSQYTPVNSAPDSWTGRLLRNSSIQRGNRENTRTSSEGIILSGGPNSVYEDGAPHCSSQVIDLGVPVLGLCYGLQLISYFLGGKV